MVSSLLIDLADRIRAHLGEGPGLAEKKMFGSIAFMRDGNMVVAPMKSGDLMVRVGKAGQDEALAQPGVRLMTMGDKTMSGFVMVDAEAIEDEAALADWIDRALAFVATLPAK